MKKIWMLLFISVIPLGYVFSQGGQWDDQLPYKNEKKSYAVFGENVNVREKPDISSNVKFVLQPNDQVFIQKKTEKTMELNQTKEYWYEIKYQNKTGYVWGGLLADAQFKAGTKTILVRNLGAKTSFMELKILENKKIIASAKWQSGPVNNEDTYGFKLLNGAQFKQSPKMLFTLDYFVFSEIEYGYREFRFFTLSDDNIVKAHFSYSPSGCDPPSCGETLVLLPQESLPADAKIKRPAYKGISGGIRLIHHSYDTDDPNIHEFSSSDYLWDGKDFILRESKN